MSVSQQKTVSGLDLVFFDAQNLEAAALAKKICNIWAASADNGEVAIYATQQAYEKDVVAFSLSREIFNKIAVPHVRTHTTPNVRDADREFKGTVILPSSAPVECYLNFGRLKV